jgi:GNAT superfamily N-acetyltransferase
MRAAPAVAIRGATAADAAPLAALSAELGYPVETAALAERLTRLITAPGHAVRVAEDAAGDPIGWIHAMEQDYLVLGRRCEIMGLVVARGRRGRGIGRALVEDVERWAAARGLPEISVRSNIVRTESHPFYLRLGYALVKTQQAYRKPLP